MVALNQHSGPGHLSNNAKRVSHNRPGKWDIPIATALVAVLLVYAWSIRDQHILTAETGLGYWLGIIGSTLMLLLLLYPLRKRIRFMNRFGAVPGWFRMHMVFGVIGPGLVLLHSNFQLGSLNSRMALFSMLLVAGSGYIGRFLYYRVQLGLSARKQMVVAMHERARAQLDDLGLEASKLEALMTVLTAFEKQNLAPISSYVSAIVRSVRAGRRRRGLRQKFALHADVPNSKEFSAALDAYLAGAKKVQRFMLYERMFSLWHLLHLPLFLILFAAAILHVVAVHLF